MNKLLNRFLGRIAGIDLSDRFSDGWDTISTVGVLLRLAAWFIRGTGYRIFFKRAKGVLLIGKWVTIRQPQYLEVGRSFIAQDTCEINRLSQTGILCGDKVTIGSYAITTPTKLYGGERCAGLKRGNIPSIGPYSYIGCSEYIDIGDNVMISRRGTILSEPHKFAELDKPMIKPGVTRSF